MADGHLSIDRRPRSSRSTRLAYRPRTGAAGADASGQHSKPALERIRTHAHRRRPSPVTSALNAVVSHRSRPGVRRDQREQPTPIAGRSSSSGRWTSRSSARPRSPSSASAPGDFEDRDAQVLGASTDTQFVHLAWRKQHPDLKDLRVPDAGRHEARALDGARHPAQGRGRAAARDLHRRSAGHDPLGRASTISRSAATSTRSCACSTRCRPTSSARATGRAGRRRSRCA